MSLQTGRHLITYPKAQETSDADASQYPAAKRSLLLTSPRLADVKACGTTEPKRASESEQIDFRDDFDCG